VKKSHITNALKTYNRFSAKTIDICLFCILFLPFLFAGCVSTIQTSSKKDKATAMADMGQSLVLQGNPREGLGYFLKAEEIDPGNPDIQHQLALVYQDIGAYDLALQHFKKAIGLKPDFSDAINDMGILYYKMKEYDKALESFRQAASNILYQTPHYAYHNMGLVYYSLGDYPRAIENFEKGLKLAPSYVYLYYDLASAYIAQNRFEEAIETYKKVAEISPQPWQANLSLAQLYIKMNRKQEATDILKSIIESNPRSQEAKDANQLLNTIQGQ
jgi:type IV pilus assembly protein PilF